MPVIGKRRCGCDCKNQTIDADQGPHNVCCRRDEGLGTPTRYGVAFECSHDWPLYTTNVPDSPCPAFWPVGVYPSITSACSSPDSISPCSVPDGLAMTYPVLELKKDCIVNAIAPSTTEPVEYNSCSYSNAMYIIGGSIIGSGCLLHSVFDSQLTELNNPSELGRLFPPYKTYVPPNIEYVKGDYYRDSALVHWEWFNGPNPAERVATDWVHLWHLDLDAATVYLEWCYDYVLNQMNGGLGKPRPRYEALSTDWDLWGRNTMVLTNPEDWPSLRPNICVFAIGAPKVPSNPCATHTQRCVCCDPGGDTINIHVVVSGCIVFPPGAVYEADLIGTRLYPGGYTGTGTGTSGVPCGVVAPSGVCGFFWATFDPGGESEPCPETTGTGPSDGKEWTGNIGIAFYCTGSGVGPTGSGPPIVVDLYCEYNGPDGLCYDGPYNASVSETLCNCDGWLAAFTASDLPCCCGSIQTCCCEGAIPGVLTAEIFVDRSALGLSNITADFLITHSGGVWTGSGDVGGSNVIINFECVDLGTSGCFVQVSLKCEEDATTWVLSVTDQHCPPAFEVVANGTGLGFCFSGSPVTVTITG